MNQEIRFAIGGLPLAGHQPLSLGPRHPTSTGVVSLTVTTNSQGRICAAEFLPGFGHRSAEKLCEVRDYRSAIMLADRHDWWSAFSGELVVAMAIEQAMRLTVPPRAIALRTLLAEYARIHSHLSFLSYVASAEISVLLWETVESIRQHLALLSGNRIHPMLCRVGGLAHDATDQWLIGLDSVFDQIRQVCDGLAQDLSATQRFSGLAIITTDTCCKYGLSGPVARASGLQLDCRHSSPLRYDLATPSPSTHTDGDAQARFLTLLAELSDSLSIIATLRSQLEPGDIAVRLARRLKVPEGEYISEIEAPWGIASCLLVSRGGQTPWRVALRTPSFANLSALESILPGTPIDSLSDVIASVGYSLGDVDR